MQQIIPYIGLTYLAICTFFDMRYRRLPVVLLAAGTVGALAAFVAEEPSQWYLRAAGALAGGFFLLAGKVTRESIGYGDGWMILNLGIFCGIWKLSALLFAAFLASALAAGIGMKVKKWKKDKRIPFVPFLLVGYLGVWRW